MKVAVGLLGHFPYVYLFVNGLGNFINLLEIQRGSQNDNLVWAVWLIRIYETHVTDMPRPMLCAKVKSK